MAVASCSTEGELSDFLDRKPVWKRLFLACALGLESGGAGIGDESGDCVCSCEKFSLSSEICGMDGSSVVVFSSGDED